MNCRITAAVLCCLICASASGADRVDYTTRKVELIKAEAGLDVKYIPLEVGQVKPEGWLRDWALQAANGITGHLDEYQNVFKHGWKGYGFVARDTNPQDGTGWPIEQCSYWLDGAVKLAYMTGDQALIDKISERLDIVVDGVLNGGDTFIYWKDADIVNDWFNNWGHAVMGRALADYYQATHDERILRALEKVYTSFNMLPSLTSGSLENLTTINRGATNVDAMTETYLESGNRIILDSIRAYASRPDTRAYFNIIGSLQGHTRSGYKTLHGVSLYEGMRVPAILGMWTGDRGLYDTAISLQDWAMEYNAMPFGLPSCEEWLSGAGPFHSIETCVVPASMWAYNWLLRISGQNRWCDLIENVFFNAGPAPIARDFKTMCYYQQPNRFSENLPWCPPIPGEGDNTFTDHGHEVLCCVGSSNWIIPNYVGNMWQATLDGGLAYLLYGPCSVSAKLRGTEIDILCKTGYPYRNDITIEIGLSKPVDMPLYFHVPSWCHDMQVSVNGSKARTSANEDGILCIRRTWKSGDKVEIQLPMGLEVTDAYEIPYPDEGYFTGSYGGLSNPLAQDREGGMPYEYVKYGPLVYSLPLEEIDENHVVPGQKYNYALDIRRDRIRVSRNDMPSEWKWDMHASPICLEVPALEFDWNPTQSLPLPKERIKDGKKTFIRLIPYNLTKFRVTMFPVAESTSKDASGSRRP